MLLLAPASASAAGPAPGTPEYLQRDNQNIADAYGRQTGQQLGNPAYTQALTAEHNEVWVQQLAQQAATPNRLAITPGNVFPGWNGGNPLRRGWTGRRGLRVPVSYTNRYGALIRGNVFAPLPGARDPYTGRRLRRPYPGVVITTGSVQGSERMYWWLAQDLAERGYVVLTYDVQGQGTSETLPHENEQVNALPFCNPFADAGRGRGLRLPRRARAAGLQLRLRHAGRAELLPLHAGRPYRNRTAGDTQVNSFNPLWRLFDRSRDRRTATPGRTRRVAIVGHSLGRLGGVVRAGGRPPRADRRRARQAERGRGRFPRAAGREAGRAGARGPVRVRLQRPALLDAARLLDPAAAGPADRGARPAPGGEHRLRRLAGGRASTRCSWCRAPRPTSSTRTSPTSCRPAATARRSRASTCRGGWTATSSTAARGCLRRASATSSRWTWAGGSRSSSTARSGSASTSAPDTRSADGSSTDIAGVGGC